MELDFFSAFIIGLLGGGHCIAMCGGITTMLTSALPHHQKNHLPYVITYNIGRIISYTFIGAIAGFSGSLAIKSLGFPVILLKMIAGLFLILLGLYIGQWLMWLTKVEIIGKQIWKLVSPFSKKLIPINSLKKSFFLGVLWGWLPCGLVYSTLTWSLASGSALKGGVIMMFFGLGTLPALLAMSLGFQHIKLIIQRTILKKAMALLLIVYGFYTLMIAYQLMI